MHVLICGAGIIGLTVAYECLKQGCRVTVIEKEASVGVHASGRNSGVLHSGIYYPKDTLKAQFCAKGKPLFRQFCLDHRIVMDRCGKLLVTKHANELESLELLYRRALDNGIDVKKLTQQDLEAQSGMAKTVDSALWVGETSVFNPKDVLGACIDFITSHAYGSILFNTAFTKRVDVNTVLTSKGPIKYDMFVNAAGGYSDKLAHQFNVGKHLTLVPFKGIYKKLRADLTKQIPYHIYPVPDLENPFLGVHFTRSVFGDVYVGPTAIPAFGPENYGLLENLGLDSLHILWKDACLFLQNKKFRHLALSEPKRYIHEYFYQEAKQLVTFLESTDLISCDKIGIRPQLVDWNTKELVMDFNIQSKDNHVHVLNAISPAFTCCFAFAQHIFKHYLK
jgi:(S)-2-hydroxyglutarate dehydrogenase